MIIANYLVARMKVLHLVGSQTSEYYYNVSAIYASGCIDAFPEIINIVLLANLNGTWCLPKSMNDTNATDELTLSEALQKLEASENKPDILQPHMFCYQGLTAFRYIADMLNIPILGSPGHVMALTTNKWQSRAVVSSVDVSVPKAVLVKPGEPIDLPLPFLLKPAREDNSMGITLVQDFRELDVALETAFQFDDLVLAEEFIPLGREIRVGVVECDKGSLEMLPCMEYFFHQKKLPIRTSLDKLNSSSDGKTLEFSPVDRECPADIDSALEEKLFDMACKAHRALECQHYSLYDVRVDPEGNPYFIEASPYCSFSPKSALVMMSCGGKKFGYRDLFYRLVRKAIQDCKLPTSVSGKDLDKKEGKQKLGMRRRTCSPTSTVETS